MKKTLLITCLLVGLSAGLSAMIVTHSPEKNVTCPSVDVPDIGTIVGVYENVETIVSVPTGQLVETFAGTVIVLPGTPETVTDTGQGLTPLNSKTPERHETDTSTGTNPGRLCIREGTGTNRNNSNSLRPNPCWRG